MKTSTTPESINKRLLLLAIPTLGQLLAEPVFVMIDTAIIGYVGDAALAGLSLGSTIILTAVGMCIFLAYATTSRVAHLLGAGRIEEGLREGINSIWLSIGIGAILTVLAFFLAAPLNEWLGGRGDVLEQGIIYTQTACLGFAGMLIVYAGNGIFRGLQRVSLTLVAAVSGAVLNVVLDIVFVIVLGWGIAGSGIATCIAQWFMGIFLIIPAVKWARERSVSLTPQLSSLKRMGGFGLPLFLRSLALRAAIVGTVMAAASMGTYVLAGYQVVNSTWNFAVNLLDAVAIAGQSLVGVQLGAKSFENARTLTRGTARFGLRAGIFVGVAFAVLGFAAAPLFTPTLEVQELVIWGMVAVGVFMPLEGWMMALDGILIGAGDYRYLAKTLCISAAAHIAALIVLSIWISPHIGSDSIRIVLIWTTFNVVLMGLRAIFNSLRIRHDEWMHAANVE